MFDSDGSGSAQQPVLLGVVTSNFNSLTVTLNNNAGDAAVAALTQAIHFENAKSDVVAGTRTVTFTLHDGGGTANGAQDSDFFTADVTVAPAENQAPVVEILASVTIDFDAFDASAGLVDGAALNAYLAGYGINISSSGPGADPVIADDRWIYGGGIVPATTGHNVFGETAATRRLHADIHPCAVELRVRQRPAECRAVRHRLSALDRDRF